MIKKFVVKGEPFGKKRPRSRLVNPYGKKPFVDVYSPKENVLHERIIREAYIDQTEGYKFPDSSDIYILIDCYTETPQSASKVMKGKMLSHMIRPKRKPDWDNLGKTICDSLNGTAFKDDSMVVDGRVRKFYAEEPRTEVLISDDYDEIVKRGELW